MAHRSSLPARCEGAPPRRRQHYGGARARRRLYSNGIDNCCVLIQQWHPDKWAKTPSLLGEAKQKFQQIQEAYYVISDRSKRMMYDAGLYSRDGDEEDTEGFADFLDEMMSLMNDVREEEKKYSVSELQSMFWEMAQDFDQIPEWDNSPSPSPSWLCGQSSFLYESGNVGSSSWETSTNKSSLGNPFVHMKNHHLCT